MIRKILSASALFCLAGSVSAQLPSSFLRGGDVSEIPAVEAGGGHYFYRGVQMDPFEIMKKAGWNFVRFRVWNHPKDGFCDKEHTLAMARRAAACGLKISLDFHYSDWWADPQKQPKPAAWNTLSAGNLTTALYMFTYDVVGAMIKQGTQPYMVQIGNEITNGMLWPDGQVPADDPTHWDNLAGFVRAGLLAVSDAARGHRHIITMIHLDRGGDPVGAIEWFDHLATYKVEFDTIGLSYYPFYHGHLNQLIATLDALARKYKKSIFVAETAYPWTSYRGDKRQLEAGYPATPEGQAKFLRKLIAIIRQVPGGLGKGLLYWAPTWIPFGENGGWASLTTFDYQGKALEGVDALGGK